MTLVKECWEVDDRGCAMYRLLQKLKRVKRKLKALNGVRYSKLKERSEGAEKHLATVQQLLAVDPLNSDLIKRDKEA